MPIVLTRRIGESVMIGDDITITLLDIHNTQVRVGIRAPRDIHIVRTEIQDRPRRAKPARVPATPTVVYRKRKKP